MRSRDEIWPLKSTPVGFTSAHFGLFYGYNFKKTFPPTFQNLINIVI